MIWQTKKLGEVLEYEQPTQYIVSSTNYKENYEIPVLTAGKSFILGRTKEKEGIFPAKDLPVIIFDDFTTATKFVDFPFKVKSSAMKILRPIKNISDAKFLFYGMQNINFDHIGIHKRYWISKYSKIEILLPSIPEQKRIVKKLDDVFERVMKAKEAAEKNLQNSKELFESYLQSIFSNPGKDWLEEELGSVCSFVRGPFGGSLKKSIFKKEGYVVYEQRHAIYNQFKDARYFIDEKKFNEMKRFELQPGDLIMSCSGTMGKIAIAPEGIKKGIINQALLKLAPHEGLYNQFLKYWMESRVFQDDLKLYTKGAAIKNLVSVKILKEIKLRIPGIQKQKVIVNNLDMFSAETKKLEKKYKQKLVDLEELKKAVLSKAFKAEL